MTPLTSWPSLFCNGINTHPHRQQVVDRGGQLVHWLPVRAATVMAGQEGVDRQQSFIYLREGLPDKAEWLPGDGQVAR